jgi:hypothetical protein
MIIARKVNVSYELELTWLYVEGLPEDPLRYQGAVVGIWTFAIDEHTIRHTKRVSFVKNSSQCLKHIQATYRHNTIVSQHYMTTCVMPLMQFGYATNSTEV